MKYFLLYTTMFFLLFPLCSQDIESKILKEREPNCKEISQTTSQLFSNYLIRSDYDSAKIILNYWEQKCNISEPILRAKILMALIQNQSIEYILKDKALIWYVHNYINRMSYDKNNNLTYIESDTYYGFVEPLGDFDMAVGRRFFELSDSYTIGSDEYLLSNFYSGKIAHVFDEIQRSEYEKSQIGKAFKKEIESIYTMAEGHFGWITGIWIPTGAKQIFGNHPDLGLLAGGKKGKWNYDFIMMFKFLKSKNQYQAIRKSNNNLPETTDHFFGGLIGIDIGRDIFVKKQHEIQAVAGIGLDGIDVLEQDETNNLDAQSILTYNLNFGLGYRYYLDGHYYIGLRAKYNLIDYTINNVVDYSGNAFTFQFILGNVSSIFKKNRLESMGVRLRQ